MTLHIGPERPPAFIDWADDRYAELLANQRNGRVGSLLVSETDRVRVWHLSVAPGERLPFHRHVLDYFWTTLTAGRSRSHYGDGRILETSYAAGDTKHFTFGRDEYMLHDLENIGDDTLVFVTVEMKQGANEPLDLGDR